MFASDLEIEQSSARWQLAGMIGGYYMSQAIFVAAKLGIADQLCRGPKTCGELALATGTHERSLHRLLRTLDGFGIFAQDDSGRFGLTRMAELLRSAVPGSLRAQALCIGETHYAAFGELLHAVKTGQPGFDTAFGMTLFDYFSANPEPAANFDAALADLRLDATAAMLDVYDFSRVKTLVDVGGGAGSLLREVLATYRSVDGILFDLPHVVERVQPHERLITIGGDFFESVPTGGDCYVLRHIIHDWDDERAVRILVNCRRAMTRSDRLLIVESVIQADNEPSISSWLDLVMLAMTGGMERTESEYRELLAASGFGLARVLPTSAGIHVLEAAPN